MSGLVKLFLLGLGLVVLTACESELAGNLDDNNDTNTGSAIDKKTIVQKLKRTGQNTAYTSFDDGYYKKGLESNYTRDDEREIVVDNITGLMWQDDADARIISKKWLTVDNFNICSTIVAGVEQNESKCTDTSGDTAATYCDNLVLGDYDDWRLPSRKELVSIVDYGRVNPAIHPIFKNASPAEYWSPVPRPSMSYVGLVDFENGYRSAGLKHGSRHIRCVRIKK